jgi:UPF0716 protein FxsA
MAFLLFLLILPLVEITLFVMVGDEIGAFNTVMLCLVAAGCGVFLVQGQGLKTMLTLQNSMQGGVLPVEEMFRGVCVFVAGLLLILPGFFTDAVAILLLLPPVQDRLRARASQYFKGEPVTFTSAQWRGGTRRSRDANGGDIVDVEYSHVETDDDEPGTRLPDQREKPGKRP